MNSSDWSAMKAAVYTKYGVPHVVRITTVPRPTPKQNEILIRVYCTTVNRTDCGFRNPVPWWVRFFSGIVRPRRKILGNEFSGIIEEIGDGVVNFKVGDAVFGQTGMRFGAHAEFLCLSQDGPLALKPKNMSHEQAAAVCDGMMMGIACIRRLGVNSGTKILVYGASGSIGTASVQFAKYYGAHVTAVCSTKDLDVVRGLGADAVIDYTKEDFTKRSDKYDVVLDAVGKHSYFRCKGVLTSKGVFASTDLGNWYQNPWLTLLTAISSGKRVLFPLPKESAADIEFFKQVIESGRYQAVIDRTYSLDQIVDAYRYVETEQKTGNVVCSVGGQSMDKQQLEIREQQKAAWNKFSAGWRKWDDLTMEFLQPVGAEIVRMIKPTGAEVILDIASGTGEPGLTIAMALDGGHVVLTDLSEDMLTIAKENADKRGVTNVETQVCDVCELPFADNTFDAISCRFGFMFFPDMELAAAEMVRVLKPGGRIATSVWSGPEKNFWVTAIGHTINRNMQLQPPPPGAPGMFRCAANGFIKGRFENAGLKNVWEQEVLTTLNSGTADVYWNMMTEVAAPFVAALGNADHAMREKIKREVFEQLAQKYPDGNVNIDGSALLIYGEK